MNHGLMAARPDLGVIPPPKVTTGTTRHTGTSAPTGFHAVVDAHEAATAGKRAAA